MGARTQPAYGGGSAEGWFTPPLDKDNLSQQPWTKNEIVVYLMDGWQAKHGIADGPMTPVVDALHKQNEIDVFAIVAYVGTLRAGEKPIDDAAVRAAALRLEWGHPDAPPPVADSVRQVIANGIRPPTGALCRSMPAFGPQMSPAEVAALVRFLRARFGRGEAWKE
jgi:nicotinate dehydrogenase subunit B